MKCRIEIVVDTDTLSDADLVELASEELRKCSECSVESICVKKEVV